MDSRVPREVFCRSPTIDLCVLKRLYPPGSSRSPRFQRLGSGLGPSPYPRVARLRYLCCGDIHLTWSVTHFASWAHPAVSDHWSISGRMRSRGEERISSATRQARDAKSTLDGLSAGFAAVGTYSNQHAARAPKFHAWKRWTSLAESGTPE